MARRFRLRALLPTLACGLLLAHSGPRSEVKAPPGLDEDPACEPYGEVVERAREQWPRFTPYALEGEVMRSFITGYNLRRAGGRPLVADQVTVFPMHSSDTWYFLAGLEGCFVFWADLAPDVAQGLMDNGPGGPGFDDIEDGAERRR